MATIESVVNAFDRMIESFKKISNAANKVEQALEPLMKATDQFTDFKTKLNAMNDGKQSVKQLNDKIFQSASAARLPYAEMLDAVGNLEASAGASFGSNNEAIAFSELMAKSFKAGGASPEEQASGMEQVTQAMAAGRMEGDGLETVLQKAPLLAQGIAEQMNVPVEKLRELGAQGAITSDVIKAAMFNSAEEINAQFEQIPLKFSDITQRMKDALLQKLQPTFQNVSTWLNSDSVKQVIDSIISAMFVMVSVVEKIVAIALTIGKVIADNWSWIAPIIWGIVGAIIAYNAVMGLAWLTMLKNIAVTAVKTIVSGAETAAIIAMTLAQDGLNAALALCPITWIIIAVIALIAIFYAVVGAINKFAGTSISATGIIAGVFTTLFAVIYNIIASVWNYWASFVEFFANMFNDPVYSAKMLFVNLANSVLDLVKTIASAMDKVFGTHLSDSITDLQSKMQSWLGEKPEGYKVVKRLEMMSIEDSAKAGYDRGKGISNKFDIKKVMNPDINGFADPSIKNNMANTAANTARMADSVDMSNENLEYMRDLAEQEVVNRYAAAEIKVDMTNHMSVNNEMDLDGVVTYLGDKLNQEMETVAEGVHF